jgi:DivIVA domain-containing protein
MRCAECGAQIAEAAPCCVRCGAPAAQRPSLVAAGPGGSLPGAPAGSASFSTTRLWPGYDEEEVDAFLGAVRDTFLGVREPPLIADEIRDKQFTTVRLRPGYDEEEVDAFLEEAEASLRALGGADDGLGGGRGDVMMTGDQIRGATFPRSSRGYDADQVRSRLSLIAFTVDAGFAPPATRPKRFATVSRGYDKQAVDRFLGTLASDGAGIYGQPMACPWPFASELPPVWDRPGPPPRRARRPRAARHQYARDCDAGWMRVSDLPGTRLRCTWERSPLAAPQQIVSSDGQVLLTRRGPTWTVAPSGQVFSLRYQRVIGVGARYQQVVDAATGRPILQAVGDHIRCQAKTVVLGLQQRWFRFPVQGSRLRNGVMTAVDESDTEVLWFRTTGRRAAEVIVSPQCALTPEILCVIELAAPWLTRYFRPLGGTLPASGPSANPPVRTRDASEEAQDRMRVRCVECGQETADSSQCCTACGAPVSQQQSAVAE